MKTLICIPCLMTGGTEIQTLNTVRALVQGGHEVMPNGKNALRKCNFIADSALL